MWKVGASVLARVGSRSRKDGLCGQSWRGFADVARVGEKKRRHPVLMGLAVVAGAAAGSMWGLQKAGEAFRDLADDGLPLVYDVDKINSFWGRFPAVIAWRLTDIFTEVGPFVVKLIAENQFGRLEEMEHQQHTIGVELRELLTRLGPCFIKFGQMLSTRPDLLPQPVLSELQNLCDTVPPFETKEAIEIIESELGSVEDMFENMTIDTEPIAAASLGQVYRLKLKHSKKTVAVKVQRPEMIKWVSLDLYILRKYSILVETIKSVLMKLDILSPRKQFDVELLDCFARGSYLELDYLNEARNQKRYQDELVPLMKGKIKIPEVYDDFTSRKVLTTEWIEGKQLIRTSPEVIHELIPVGVECFLRQLLDTCFLHCDPHAGNLLVDDQKRLVLIDFGLCAQVPPPDTKTMTQAILHLMDGDMDGLVDDAVLLGFLPEDVNKTGLLQELLKILKESKISDQKQLNLDMLRGGKARRKKFKEVSRELNSVFYRYPFQVPDYFALITRALIVLEGIAVIGDPDFDIFQAAYPFCKQRSYELFETTHLFKIIKWFF